VVLKRTSKDRAFSMSAAASDLLAKNRNGIERSRTIGFSVRFTSSSRAIAIRAREVVVVVVVAVVTSAAAAAAAVVASAVVVAAAAAAAVVPAAVAAVVVPAAACVGGRRLVGKLRRGSTHRGRSGPRRR